MKTDEKMMQKAFDLLDPFVRLGWTVAQVVDVLDATGVFFDNGAAMSFKKSAYRVVGRSEEALPVALASVRRVKKQDGSDEWRLDDEHGRMVLTVGLAHPADPLPAYVAALKEALVGSRVQSVTVSDSGLCLHLDDDYDAVTNGSLRVRVDSERVPFTVGDVFVNRGGGDLVLCVCAQPSEDDKDGNRPVVVYKINRDTLDRKEISFNVI